MAWTTTTDPEAFLAAAEAFLRAAPAANSVTLTTVEALRGQAAAADAVPALVDVLGADGRAIPGVSGDLAATEAFAAAWTARTGARARVWRRMRLHRLDALVEPDPTPPGGAAPATGEHRDLAVAWFEAFAREIVEPARDLGTMVDDRIGYGGLVLWMLD